jgi:hypothetical protein
MPVFRVSVTERIKLAFDITAESREAAEQVFQELVGEDALPYPVDVDTQGFTIDTIENAK